MKLIGVAGAKGVGKDTFFNVLKSRLMPVQRIAFADCIKADVSQLPGIEGATKEDIRAIYQEYGEVAKKLQGSDYWLDRLKPVLSALDTSKATIVTDVRFKFEAEWINQQGGVVVVVTRPGSDGDDHVSEQDWRQIDADHQIENFSSRQLYAQAVVETWELIKRNSVVRDYRITQNKQSIGA